MTTPMPADERPKTTYWKHGWEKCKREPLVPIGAVATTGALLGASLALKSGNRRGFQNFLRLRVVTQGLTVLAMVVGAYYLTEKAETAFETRDKALRGRLPDAPSYPAPRAEPKEVVTDAAEDHLYPPRAKTRVSDFTKRLRSAEEQQAADEAALKK